jgi:hypothetical protein
MRSSKFSFLSMKSASGCCLILKCNQVTHYCLTEGKREPPPLRQDFSSYKKTILKGRNYDESQLEFQLNNIRHLQHHIAQSIERHDIVNSFEYEWY